MPKKRERYQFRFWLDARKRDELELGGYCEQLIKERKFVTTIRNGLALMRDLQAGRVDALLYFFPWVEEHFSGKNDARLQHVLSEIQSLRDTMNSRPATAQALQPLEPSSRSASKPLEPMPELELTVSQTKSNEIPAYNMFLSGIGIGSLKVHEIPEKILRYAVEMNKLTGKTLAEAKRILEQSTNDQPKPTAGNPKQMNVPDALPVPTFDDLPDDW